MLNYCQKVSSRKRQLKKSVMWFRRKEMRELQFNFYTEKKQPFFSGTKI